MTEIEEKLQKLAKEYIGDVMCDSWLNKVKSLIAEEVEEIIGEAKPKKRSKKSFLIQCNLCSNEVEHPHLKRIKYSKPYISIESKAFKKGIDEYNRNMRKLAKEKGIV